MMFQPFVDAPHVKLAKLRILHLSPAPIWDVQEGSGMPSIYLGLRGFVEAGHQVVFAVAGQQTRSYDYHGITIHEWRVPVPVAPIRHRWLHRITQKAWGAAYYLIAFVRGVRLAARFKPDVVYGHFLYGAPVAWAIGRIFRIPNVTRMYGTFLHAYVGTLWGRLWKVEETAAFLTPCTYMIITNDGTRGRDVARALGVPEDRVKYWRNGVDKELLARAGDPVALKQELAIPADHRLIVAISRLADWKRVDRLIAAMPAVIARVPGVTAVIVGDGPERAALERLADELGVRGNVRFTGLVAHDDIPKYLCAADIFTSLYDVSNAGNPILEALVAGRCVVSINNGGTGEINEHGEVAKLLEPDRVTELPQVLIALLQDDAQRARYESAARTYARDHLRTWTERVRMEVELIEQLVSTHRGRPVGRPSGAPGAIVA